MLDDYLLFFGVEIFDQRVDEFFFHGGMNE